MCCCVVCFFAGEPYSHLAADWCGVSPNTRTEIPLNVAFFRITRNSAEGERVLCSALLTRASVLFGARCSAPTVVYTALLCQSMMCLFDAAVFVQVVPVVGFVVAVVVVFLPFVCLSAAPS